METILYNKKERIAKWDNVKCILILLVVIGHFAEIYVGESENIKSLFFYIYLFHMPAFIFISGLFSKNVVLEKRYSKIMGCFSVYLVMSILIFVTIYFLTGEYSFSLFNTSNVAWFIFSIGIYYFLTIILQRIEKRYIICVFILLACFAGYDQSIGDLLILSRNIAFYPFFYIGYCLKSDKLLNFLESKKIKVVLFILLIAVGYICLVYIDQVYWIRPLITGRNHFFKLKQYAMFGCILRFLWYILGFILTFALISITPASASFLSKIGKRSLQVYVLHGPILCAWNTLNADAVMQMICPDYWKFFSVIVIPIVVTILLSCEIFEKPLQWLLNPPIFLKEENIETRR